MKRLKIDRELDSILSVHNLYVSKEFKNKDINKITKYLIKRLIYNNYRRRKNGVQESKRICDGVKEMFARLPLHIMPKGETKQE